MLTIRMQRNGRKGHAMFRVIVQDSRRTPTSGRVVAYLGSYDPHAKTSMINKEKVSFYLDKGAQPSPRVVSLLKAEKLKLPAWVAEVKPKKVSVKHPEKRRSTSPQTEAEPEQVKPEPSVDVATEVVEETT